MATISHQANGLKRLEFTGLDGARKTIYLGRVSKSDAATVKTRVELLLHAAICGTSPSRETSIWLTEIAPVLKIKLSKFGIVPGVDVPVPASKMTIKDYFDKYIETRKAGMKPGTIEIWKTAIASLIEYLPKDITLQRINAAHADDWLDAMRSAKHPNGKKKFAGTTIYKRIGFARQFFTYAVKSKLILSNPFSEISIPRPKPKSNVEVPRETIEAVLAVCDPTWKAIVSLSRYAGLRCPSEVLTLKWCDVDFEAGTLRIVAPKTEHHDGEGIRLCPLFPEVHAALEPLPRSGEYVIDKPAYRIDADTDKGWKNCNLRTQFLKQLAKANVKPWKRIFHSMRASCQTELEDRFGLPAACSWLGNTAAVARESYLLVFEDKWLEAIGKTTVKSTATKPNQA